MAFDVVMFGSLTIPQRNLEEWLASFVEQTEFPWLDEVGGDEVLQDTAEALLTYLSAVTCAPHELFEVRLEGERLTVQCYASEDTFRATSQALGLLFGSSAAHGGLGELCFAGYQGIRFGERLTVRFGRTTFRTFTEEELARLEQEPAFQALDARIHERYDALVGRPASGPVELRNARWVTHPFTGRRVRVGDEATG
jgi:hypothetical protein